MPEIRPGDGGFWCVHPLATRGDGAGVPPSRGKDGGEACCSFRAAEKEGLVGQPSSSADSCVFRWFCSIHPIRRIVVPAKDNKGRRWGRLTVGQQGYPDRYVSVMAARKISGE